MVRAVFNFKNESFVSFEIKGHAEFSDEGQDIVCSAITSCVFTSINLLERLFTNKYLLIQKEGYVSLSVNEIIKDGVFINIIDNLIDNLKMIEDDYPQNIKVILNK